MLIGAESAGKHVFVEFPGERFVQVHLGLIGRFDIEPGIAPEPVGQIRWRLQGLTAPASYADLRGAITCQLVDLSARQKVLDALGPDPLRADADPERAWNRISRSDRVLGDLLMDQHVLAGVGNVYRAEVLFRHRLDPMTPGRNLRRKTFDAIWADLVDLLAEGVRVGRIDTVRAEHTPEAMGRPPRVDDHGGEVYVYRRTGQACLVCGSTVRTRDLKGRNLFWCPRCQRRHG